MIVAVIAIACSVLLYAMIGCACGSIALLIFETSECYEPDERAFVVGVAWPMALVFGLSWVVLQLALSLPKYARTFRVGMRSFFPRRGSRWRQP